MATRKSKGIRPKLFIGSSSEFIEAAKLFKGALKKAANANTIGWWEADEFQPTRSTLVGLIDAASEYDFGLFLLTPDDRSISRKKAKMAPRDNVLFEFGLFLGSIGDERTFAVTPQSLETKVPSDLAGITIVRFQDDKDSRINAKDAVRKISALIRKRRRRQFRYVLAKSWGYDEKKFEFSVCLDAVRLALRGERLFGKQFLLVARKHDEHELFETDTRLAVGSPLDCINLRSEDLFLAARDPQSFKSIKNGDRIEGQLMVLEKEFDVHNCANLVQFVESGAELLDSMGVTARICK